MPTDTLHIIPADSIVADSAIVVTRQRGIELINPGLKETPLEQNTDNPAGTSWIFSALFVVFCLIAFRFHNNSRFIKAFVRDLTETRTRNNVFDDTVKESFLLILLNIQWILCSGILIFFGLKQFSPHQIPSSIGISTGCGLCTLVSAIYAAGLWIAYFLVGNVFSDSRHTRVWLKGYTASQALCGIAFFFLSLLVLCYPQLTSVIIYIAISVFCLTKIIFLFKGFRIFFSQMSSWVLFLYYLCSLEIIPVIMLLLGASYLCSIA